jgi:hypothetical protein
MLTRKLHQYIHGTLFFRSVVLMISSAREFAGVMKQACQSAGCRIEPFTPPELFGQPRHPNQMMPQAAISPAFSAVSGFLFFDMTFECSLYRFQLIAGRK